MLNAHDVDFFEVPLTSNMTDNIVKEINGEGECSDGEALLDEGGVLPSEGEQLRALSLPMGVVEAQNAPNFKFCDLHVS